MYMCGRVNSRVGMFCWAVQEQNGFLISKLCLFDDQQRNAIGFHRLRHDDGGGFGCL